MSWEKLVELLKGHKTYLQMHNFPDPDALASAYGMQVFLKKNGVDSVICYAGKIDKNSTKRMLDEFGIEAVHIDELHDMTAEDYIVTIDAQKNNSNITNFPGTEVACIDHHPTMVPATYKYSDIRICGACSSMVAEYFVESGIELDYNTATALLYGIKMDTDSFNRGVTELDIQMFAYLHRLADNHKVVSMYNNNMGIEDLQAYGEAIRTIRIYENVGFAKITFDCAQAQVAMISDFILGLDAVKISVVYSMGNDGYRFSVRNETRCCHAGEITKEALSKLGGGGGGHFSMAGGTVPREKIEEFGNNIDVNIRKCFLDEIDLENKNYMENRRKIKAAEA